MAEADRELNKTEMTKPYVWLKITDGSIQQIEQDVAMFCPLLCQEVLSGVGTSRSNPISLPSRVSSTMLSLILEYCSFHLAPGRSNKERRIFDEKFIRMDTKRLCELTSAAESLKLRPLVDITSRALARMIEDKSPEEIREIFNLPDDLTEEEKLEPLKNTMDDPRIRLLNRLYARKRKELKDRQKPKNDEVEEERGDDRSVDDLLSFINGGNGEPNVAKTSKSKKKNRKKKDQQKNGHQSCGASSTAKDNDKPIEHDSINQSNGLSLPVSLQSLRLQDTSDHSFIPENEFADGDLDDEIDPALKEKIDREVEDFARRLNSDWPERMQEILCLGQERQSRQITMKMDSSIRRNTRLQ